MDWVVGEVKSCCDCCVDFDLVLKVDGHWMPQTLPVMELSLYYEEMLEVHAAYVVAVETVVALPDSWSQVELDCIAAGSLAAVAY